MRGNLRFDMLDALCGDDPILVLSPHPDDETLACGGLLARAFATRSAHVICMTDGSASHPQSVRFPPYRLASVRKQELKRAIGKLGGAASDITWLGLPDGALGTSIDSDTFNRISDIIISKGGLHLFSPTILDHHEDHKVTARLADALFKRGSLLSLISYPVWSRWDDQDFENTVAHFHPVSVPIGREKGRKRSAALSYKSQLGELVDDDPSGFVMNEKFLSKFVDEPEIYWRIH